jgi:hypothetical protein
MIPVQTQRSVETSPTVASASFGISQNDVAHILTMLRDTLYSDRVLAVLREYAANAWDVHREVGKGDVPIQVTLPTLEAPTLEIRDFGTGISREDMLGRFLMAGASTKRNSNIAVGTLGIGRLSGFAYGDSFVVESRHAGVCSTYVAVIDASERGRIDLLDEQPATDTGLAIRLAVRAADIAEFREKAKRLFAYMHPRPTVNVELPAMGARFGDGVLLDEEDAGWSAVMGCVSYPIDLNQINPARFVNQLSGVLYFDIGTLHFSASREALKYTDQTKRALKDKLNTFLDDYVRSQLAAIESQATSPWDRRLRLLRLRRFELPWLKLDTTAPLSIELPEFKTFSLCTRDGRKKYKATKLAVHPATRFVLRDDKRALSGFRFGLNDYIATPEAEYTWVDAELSLGLLVSDLQIEGIPIVRTSALPWTALPRRERSGARSRTPRGRAFMLRPSNISFCQPYSRYWEPVRRDAEASDVYVTLNAFRCGDFYAKYRDDAAICAALKLGSMPVVYGYKCGHAPAVGQKYETWRSAFLASSLKLLHVQELLAQLAYVNSDSPSGDATAAIEERLGADHPVARLCRRMHEASKMPFEVKHALRDLLTQTNAKHPTADTSALRRYPLLAAEGIAKLWGNHAAAWLDYVAGKKRAK